MIAPLIVKGCGRAEPGGCNAAVRQTLRPAPGLSDPPCIVIRSGLPAGHPIGVCEYVGKPFDKELSVLPSTYEWALATDVKPLSTALAQALGRPLVVTGSGGSLTAADFACSAHQLHGTQLARAYSPLELVGPHTGPSLHGATTLILSAGGKNPDILAAARHVTAREPRQTIVLVATRASPLADLARSADADVFEFAPPSGRDGFLATNTLFGFLLLLYRGYREALGVRADLPDTLDGLLGADPERESERLREQCSPLWTRDTLIVLHGATTRSAALDLESKFTEAALGSVQLADFRNFAHGRHHWLAKRGSASGVLALVTDEDRDLAARTLEVLPRDQIPVVTLSVPGAGLAAAVSTFVRVLYVTAAAGRARHIDPGRPGVPAFGRKLYNLRALRPSERSSADAAIERKSGRKVGELALTSALDDWRDARRAFLDRLHSGRFGAVVLDYDGTICDARERRSGIRPEIAELLNTFIGSGLLVGIATGRGKSVREALLERVTTRRDRVWIGYYNGGYIRSLDEPVDRQETMGPDDTLRAVESGLRDDPWLRDRVEVDVNRFQLSVRSRVPVPETRLWDAVEQVSARFGATVVRSSHSVDVLAFGVTKRSLVQGMRDAIEGRDVLCIGDRGRWPGNDHALLMDPYSLSADEVSSDPMTCWNLAPPGTRGVGATMGYLQRLTVRRGSARLSFTRTS